MIAFDEATRRVAALARPLGTETLGLASAAGAVLSKPVVSRRGSPARAVSAMDGYAVRDVDLANGPARIPVIGQALAGAPAAQLAPGACMRIFTGAPMPEGADRVVVQEEVEREGDLALFSTLSGGRRHVRAAGSDFAAGDILVPAGAVLDPHRLVAVAAADLAAVEVVRRPRVVVLSTGDELHEPGTQGHPDSIPESVSFGVAALAQTWGAVVTNRRRLPDELSCLRAAALAALESADVVVVTGGASVGERDFAKTMFEPAGIEILISKVAIKPGKPVWVGRVDETLVVGLPGNPTAAMVTARLFLAPLLAGLSGRDPHSALIWRQAVLARGLEPCGERETFHRGRWTKRACVAPLDDQDSSAQRALAMADVLIHRPAGARLAKPGYVVPILAL